MTAATTGDLDGLMAMLAPDATWTADSDGKASAARRPIVGATQGGERGRRRSSASRPNGCRISGSSRRSTTARPRSCIYNGRPAGGRVPVEITDGQITHFYAMRNPDKLAGVDVRREITRRV